MSGGGSEAFDAYHKWLGIPPKHQPPTHYRLLAIDEFESDPDVIEHAADRMMLHVRQFQIGAHSGLSQRILNEIAAAKRCLLTPTAKARYDTELRTRQGVTGDHSPAPGPQEFGQPLDALLSMAQPAPFGLNSLAPSASFERHRPRKSKIRAWAVAAAAGGTVVVVLLVMVVAIAMSGRSHRPETAINVDERVKSQPTANSESQKRSVVRLPANEKDDGSVTERSETAESDMAASDGSKSTDAQQDSAPFEAAARRPLAVAPFDAEQALAFQEKAAADLDVPVELVNRIGMKFRLIPAGEFMMGSAPEEIDGALAVIGGDAIWSNNVRSQGPQHRVIVTRPIYLGIHEVTQSQFEQVMGQNPSHFAASGPGKDVVAGLETSKHPVEMVSWNEAVAFCTRLNESEQKKPIGSATNSGGPSSSAYRLPTDAEWEFACRAGTTTRNWIGEQDEQLGQAAWTGTNSGGRTHPVGELKANPFGLYDVQGNVWEWVQDGWDLNYFAQFNEQAALDPSGPADASLRVLRGGSWPHPDCLCWASSRRADGPPDRNVNFGFRVALSIEAPAGNR